MEPTVILAFVGPVLLVFAMAIAGRVFKGWKTNAVATLTTVVAGAQTMDFSFLPPSVMSALLTGCGIATLVASGLTERKDAR